MQHAAFGVYLVEFDPAGLRHAQAMPEHEKQQATVANLCEPPPVFLGGASRPVFPLFGVFIILSRVLTAHD
jgi:hypothetical protein